MSTKAAYLSVIIIWSTTPLAIKWSSEDVGYLFGVTSRMLLGVVATYLLLYIMKNKMPWHRRAVATYVVGSMSIYATMSCIYWAAQFIPSGWISVIFGLSPFITGLCASMLLREKAFTTFKLIGLFLGLAGLLVVFAESLNTDANTVYGMLAVLIGTTFYSVSGVLVKRIDANISGIAATAGGLTIAVPLYLITWWLFEGDFPIYISTKALSSILYLGVIGSAIGFALYYYILSRMEVSKVSLIALITPLFALAIGNVFNDEPINDIVIVGALLIIIGLVFYEYGPLLFNRIIKFNNS